MIEIRFHGRGGQGAVTASEFLARAAFLEGNDVQSFPMYGVERRGAPVTAFTRIDSKAVRNKAQIHEPDIVIVMDMALLDAVDVTAGIKPDGKVILNTDKAPDDIDLGVDNPMYTVDASSIAVEHRLGSKVAPIVNTAILGAIVRATGVVDIDTLVEVVRNNAPAKKEENAKATKQAYEEVRGEDIE